MKIRKGFTVMEAAIVIAIIAILAAAVFVAIDPARRMHEARNGMRNGDIYTILDGVGKYKTDNNGAQYSVISNMTEGSYYELGTCSSGATCALQPVQPACVNLLGIGYKYLATIPKDPNIGTDAETKYYIMKDASGVITVGACNAEGGGSGGSGTPPVIKVSR
jgi:prepilin-type N-terminal cleavage/methylation domain-containing protein